MRINGLRRSLTRLVLISLTFSGASISALGSSSKGLSRPQRQKSAAPIADSETAKAIELALAKLAHAETLLTQKDELIASKDQTIQAQAQTITLKDAQLTEKDKQITALQTQNGLLTQSNEDCKQDRQRIAAERNSARQQNWLFAAVGAVVVAVLKGSN